MVHWRIHVEQELINTAIIRVGVYYTAHTCIVAVHIQFSLLYISTRKYRDSWYRQWEYTATLIDHDCCSCNSSAPGLSALPCRDFSFFFSVSHKSPQREMMEERKSKVFGENFVLSGCKWIILIVRGATKKERLKFKIILAPKSQKLLRRENLIN